MALADQAYLASEPVFVGRASMAMTAAAVAIGNSATNPSSTYQVLRHALATKALTDPYSWGPVFARAVASNVAITNASTDSDIEYTVSTVWDAIAGAGPAPTP